MSVETRDKQGVMVAQMEDKTLPEWKERLPEEAILTRRKKKREGQEGKEGNY